MSIDEWYKMISDLFTVGLRCHCIDHLLLADDGCSGWTVGRGGGGRAVFSYHTVFVVRGRCLCSLSNTSSTGSYKNWPLIRKIILRTSNLFLHFNKILPRRWRSRLHRSPRMRKVWCSNLSRDRPKYRLWQLHYQTLGNRCLWRWPF